MPAQRQAVLVARRWRHAGADTSLLRIWFTQPLAVSSVDSGGTTFWSMLLCAPAQAQPRLTRLVQAPYQWTPARALRPGMRSLLGAWAEPMLRRDGMLTAWA